MSQDQDPDDRQYCSHLPPVVREVHADDSVMRASSHAPTYFFQTFKSLSVKQMHASY
jgi:hypothetical protein